MSDAKGETDDLTTGEPIEAAASAAEIAADDATRAVPTADDADDATRAVPTSAAPEAGADADANGEAGTTDTAGGAAAADDAADATHDADPGADAPATGVADADAGATTADDSARAVTSGEAARAAAMRTAPDPDEPTPAGGAPETSVAADPAGEPAEDAAGEVDYAALAAELEEFESRQAGASGAVGADAAAHAAEEEQSGGWFEQAPDTFRATEPGEDAPTEVILPPGAPEPADDATAVLAQPAEGETAVMPQAEDHSETAVITPSEPTAQTATAAATGAAAGAAASETFPKNDAIFETFEPPRKRGNRTAALLIGIPATIVFAVLYAVIDLVYGWFQNDVQVDTLVDDLVPRILEVAFWVPVAVFFLAFWLVGVIVNRGRAGWWVVLGFLVALATYLGFVFAPVLTYPFWLMTPSQATEAVDALLLHPVAIGVFIIAREVTVWFGAWVAGRGRKMKRLNAEDKAEYEKALAEAD